MNDSSDELVELLTLTLTTDRWGDRNYRNSSGELHRHHGPAVICTNGDRYWRLNGELHRTTGPAIECVDGDKLWYLDGQQLTEAEFNECISTLE